MQLLPSVVVSLGGSGSARHGWYYRFTRAVLPLGVPSGTTCPSKRYYRPGQFLHIFFSFLFYFLILGLVPSSLPSFSYAITGSGAGQRRAATRPRGQKLQFGYTFEEDIEEEELVPTKTKSRARSTESDQGPSKKTKKPMSKIPKKPMNKISLKEYAALRGIDPYGTPKNTRACPNPRFYTKDQERIFNEVYGPKKSSPRFGLISHKSLSNLY